GRTHYRTFRRGGYPLGSGGMESANKFICHVRLKRSGAWWYEESSNQMLALRCAKYNGTFSQILTRNQRRKAGVYELPKAPAGLQWGGSRDALGRPLCTLSRGSTSIMPLAEGMQMSQILSYRMIHLFCCLIYNRMLLGIRPKKVL